MNKKLLMELNRICAEEMKPEWYWVCLFCGKKSAEGRWMFKHIKSHLKQCMPKCSECGIQHLPNGSYDYDETLDAHTITVAPNEIWIGKKYAGF